MSETISGTATINFIDVQWNSSNHDVSIKRDSGFLTVTNSSSQPHSILSDTKVPINARYGFVDINGGATGDGAIFYIINESDETIAQSTLNSRSVYDFKDHSTGKCRGAIWINPYSTITIHEARIEFFDDEARRREFIFGSMTNNVLVVSPDYPATENKYLAGFVHTRVKAYIEAGISVDLFVTAAHTQGMRYEFEGVRVLKSSFEALRELLRLKKYDKILIHFFDEKYARVFDASDLSTTDILIWVHGPETLYWDWPMFTTGYFNKPDDISPENRELFKIRDEIIRRYNSNPNVTWIFVSDWIKERSEGLVGLRFSNFEIIPNYIDEQMFLFSTKNAALRKKIFMLRRFDDVNKYAIDINVRCILELSKRDCFSDLEFSIYGSGAVHDKLIEPLLTFDNVKIHTGFLSHEEIAAIHKQHGVALFASRYDAQGVSMCEAAMSGVAVVSSNIEALYQFLPSDLGLLADVEDHNMYADAIEKMIIFPEYFEECSEACHKKVKDTCGKEKTLDKEVSLVKKQSEHSGPTRISANGVPVLTIAIPAYNAAEYLATCVSSLLDHENAAFIEILIINDGSKDNTIAIAMELIEKYNNKSNPVVTLINKANGGHGSAINAGIANAHGKYFRVVDCDDWVNSRSLSLLVDKLKDEDASIVITDYSEDRLSETYLAPKRLYQMLSPDVEYRFDDLCHSNFGFEEWGPILATGNFLTENLRKTNFKLTEHSSYVDMEFDMYSIIDATSIKYYDLDIYRYVIGSETQTISKSSYIRCRDQHENVLLNLIKYVDADKKLSKEKKHYIVEKLIVPMVVSQFLILGDWLRDKNELFAFIDTLSNWNWVKEHKTIKEEAQRYRRSFSLRSKARRFLGRVYRSFFGYAQKLKARVL